ncbi:MAG TPA: hypothetical protein VGM36_03735 [Rhizomicrobium sp.]|jgi:hypothetical protein
MFGGSPVEPSGSCWVSRFPGSTSLDDLLPDFRGRVRAFLLALKDGGANIRIAATYRPPERAWLMHWSWLVVAGVDPAKVPHLKTIDIAWLHTNGSAPDVAASRAAAKAMVARYGIKYPPVLASRHTQRRAIDMTIGWKGALHTRDASGAHHLITSSPRSGLNYELIEIGKSFGVTKLFSDPPHWSDDGH